jgi:Fur family ferric uptake transcriptional regulator
MPERACSTSPQRASRARRDLQNAVERMPGAFTVDDLIEAARRDGSSVSVATAYRTVAAMAQASRLERVGTRDGAALFLSCERHRVHHHHVVCDRCGSVAVADCPLDHAPATPAVVGGFVVTRHEIALYGLCPSCASEEG